MASANIIKKLLLKRNAVEVLPGLVCKVLDEKCLPQVRKLLASEYANNPVQEIHNIPPKEKEQSDAKAAEKYLKCNNSPGIFAKQTDELVAMMINSVERKVDGDSPYEITPDTSQRVAVQLRFINELFGDVFSDLNTDCYMRGRYACTSPEYRSKGLTGILTQITSHLAKAKGCEYHVTFAGSLYIQKAAKSYGGSVLREASYADYIDPQTGLKPDWKISPIHKAAQVVYKKIPANI